MPQNPASDIWQEKCPIVILFTLCSFRIDSEGIIELRVCVCTCLPFHILLTAIIFN
jgi:hypothetical protein